MSMLRNATLRWHILFIVLVSGIPGIAIVGYSAWLEENHLRAAAMERSTIAAHHVALEQRRLTAQTEQLLRRLAAMREFARRDYEGCHRQISRLLEFSHTYANFGLATLRGDVTCSILPPGRRENIAHREYFQQAVGTRVTFFGGYQISRTTGQPSFPISAPIFDGPRLAGVAYAIVPTAWYNLMAEESPIPPGFTMTVLDRNLNILARVPGDPWIGKNIAGHPLAALLRGVEEETTAEIPGLDDKAHFAALAPLFGSRNEGAGFVVVSAPKSEVFAAARAAVTRNLIALLIVIVAVILAAWLGAERLVLRYVRNLVEASRRLRSGDMTARMAERGGSREIQVLAQTFNEMAGALHERELALKQAQRLARVGSWEWNIEGDATVWSEELYRIHGVDPGLAPLGFKELAERCVPESRERLKAAVDQARRTGRPYELDLLMAGERWITVRGETVRDATGRIVKLRGTSQDITARKQAEAELLAKNRELAGAVEQLQAATDQRVRAEKSALSYAERLRAMSRRIVDVQEADQRSFARELHDNVSSSLAVVGLELHAIEEELSGDSLAKVGPKLADCIELVKGIMADARDISSDMHSAMLEHAGLAPALEDLGNKLARRTGLSIAVTGPEQRQRAPAHTELALFRIAQEALTNCVKHAHASRAEVGLSFSGGTISLSVMDDGQGFDPVALNKTGLFRQGLGILSMRERAEAIGGQFAVTSAPGKGTKIAVSAPCRDMTSLSMDYVI